MARANKRSREGEDEPADAHLSKLLRRPSNKGTCLICLNDNQELLHPYSCSCAGAICKDCFDSPGTVQMRDCPLCRTQGFSLRSAVSGEFTIASLLASLAAKRHDQSLRKLEELMETHPSEVFAAIDSYIAEADTLTFNESIEAIQRFVAKQWTTIERNLPDSRMSTFVLTAVASAHCQDARRNLDMHFVKLLDIGLDHIPMEKQLWERIDSIKCVDLTLKTHRELIACMKALGEHVLRNHTNCHPAWFVAVEWLEKGLRREFWDRRSPYPELFDLAARMIECRNLANTGIRIMDNLFSKVSTMKVEQVHRLRGSMLRPHPPFMWPEMLLDKMLASVTGRDYAQLVDLLTARVIETRYFERSRKVEHNHLLEVVASRLPLSAVFNIVWKNQHSQMSLMDLRTVNALIKSDDTSMDVIAIVASMITAERLSHFIVVEWDYFTLSYMTAKILATLCKSGQTYALQCVAQGDLIRTMLRRSYMYGKDLAFIIEQAGAFGRFHTCALMADTVFPERLRGRILRGRRLHNDSIHVRLLESLMDPSLLLVIGFDAPLIKRIFALGSPRTVSRLAVICRSVEALRALVPDDVADDATFRPDVSGLAAAIAQNRKPDAIDTEAATWDKMQSAKKTLSVVQLSYFISNIEDSLVAREMNRFLVWKRHHDRDLLNPPATAEPSVPSEPPAL